MPNEVVRCDGCGAHGRRRRDHPSPDFWFYIESVDRTNPRKHGVYIIWACSELCRDNLWKRGPGPANINENGTDKMRAKLIAKEDGSG